MKKHGILIILCLILGGCATSHPSYDEDPYYYNPMFGGQMPPPSRKPLGASEFFDKTCEKNGKDWECHYSDHYPD